MSAYTCMNCKVQFASLEAQREHYKSNWHRCNLNRRASRLPVLKVEAFENRELRKYHAEQQELLESQTCWYCKACRRQFNSLKAHDNHLQSRRHKENLGHLQCKCDGEAIEITTIQLVQHPATMGRAIKSSEVAFKAKKDESDENHKGVTNPLTLRDCLFCSHKSVNMDATIRHMSSAHSFFIPDIEYCTNPEGLLHYLGEKVANHFICLWCNDRKTFYSLDAVRKHMMDKGHCQILHESLALAEYAPYYDYGSTGTASPEDVVVNIQITSDMFDGDEYLLVLPSGAAIGHRSLMRYYKQNLNPTRTMPLKKLEHQRRKTFT